MTEEVAQIVRDSSENMVDGLDNNDSIEIDTGKGDEHKRLGGYPPLQTIVRLCPGPIISQFVNSLYGVVDSIWVSKFIGELGLTALSLAYIIDNSALSFGFFLATAASSQISYLFSKKLYEEISHLSIDLFRIAIIFALIVPAILLPCSMPLFKFLGGEGKVNTLALQYVLPLCALNLFTCMYHTVCGILQAEGRTWAYAGAQILSMILNMVLLDPLLLFLIKNTSGSSLATEFSMFIPALIIFILLWMGKFSTKPSAKYFKKCFSREAGESLKTGLSAFIMNISIGLPSLIMQKFIAIRANRVNHYDMIVAVYNALCRIYNVSMCVPIAMNAAYLPAASYAFGLKDYKRILLLTFHVVWISVVWGLFVSFVVIVFPAQVCTIWSKNDDFLYWCKEIVPVSFYCTGITGIKFIVISFLQASQQTITATVMSFITELGILPIVAAIFHYKGGDPNSPKLIFYAYPVSDAITTVCSISVAMRTLIKFYRLSKEKEPEKKDSTSSKSSSEEDQPSKIIPEL